MIQPTLQRTWKRDEIVEALREAQAIVDELQPPDDLRGSVYAYAVQLVTQRALSAPAPILLGKQLLGG